MLKNLGITEQLAAFPGELRQRFLQLIDECRNNFVKIPNNPIIGETKYFGMGILVDRHNCFGIDHARGVLDSP